MNKEMTSLWLTQGEVRMQIVMPSEAAERMAQIKQRYPEDYWSQKEMDLYRLANEELKLENAEEKPQEMPKPRRKGLFRRQK